MPGLCLATGVWYDLGQVPLCRRAGPLATSAPRPPPFPDTAQEAMEGAALVPAAPCCHGHSPRTSIPNPGRGHSSNGHGTRSSASKFLLPASTQRAEGTARDRQCSPGCHIRAGLRQRGTEGFGMPHQCLRWHYLCCPPAAPVMANPKPSHSGAGCDQEQVGTGKLGSGWRDPASLWGHWCLFGQPVVNSSILLFFLLQIACSGLGCSAALRAVFILH